MSISTEISETGIVIQSISPVDRIVTLKYFENGREVVKAVAVPAGIFQKTIPGKTPMFLDSDEMDVDIEKKELRQGEHKTPPEGYPSSRSEYADPDHYMFPLDTESRVRSAIGYFDKHDWASNEHKKRAAKRIVAAAKKFGIVVDKDDVVSRTARG